MNGIADGTSNSLMIGESKYMRIFPTASGAWDSWAGGPHVGTSNWVMLSATSAVVDSINSHPTPAVNSWDVQNRRFGSFHTGGAHFTMADGSVQFISDNMDIGVLRVLASIRDGQVVSF